MSRFMMFVVFLACLVAQPGFADEGNKVVGTWKLVSYEVEVQATGQKGPVEKSRRAMRISRQRGVCSSC
jgi:hypothetical protein